MAYLEISVEKELYRNGPACSRCGGPVPPEMLPGLNACDYCGGSIYLEPVRLPAAPIERPVSLKVARSMHANESYGLMQIHMEGVAKNVYGRRGREEKVEGQGGVEFVEGMLAAFNRTTELDIEERDETFWKQVAQVPPSEDGKPRSEKFRAGYLEGLAYAIGLNEQTSGDDANFYYRVGLFSRILSGADR